MIVETSSRDAVLPGRVESFRAVFVGLVDMHFSFEYVSWPVRKQCVKPKSRTLRSLLDISEVLSRAEWTPSSLVSVADRTGLELA